MQLLASYFVVVPLREEAGISLGEQDHSFLQCPVLMASCRRRTSCLSITSHGWLPELPLPVHPFPETSRASKTPLPPSGTDTLPKLFTATLLGALLVTPLTSAFLSRPNIPHEASLRQFYAVLASIMLGFYLAYYLSTVQAQAALRQLTDAVAGEGLAAAPPPPVLPPGSAPAAAASVQGGDPSLDGPQRALRAAFYIFLNVQNLVAMSACWARCADVFNAEAASRLFGFISAGRCGRAVGGGVGGRCFTLLA